MGLYTWIFIICNVLISRTEVSVHAHHLNLNVAVLVERTPELEMPFIINRTIGIIELGKIKAQEITKNSTQMNFIVQPLDAPICVPQGFGALVAKLYHTTGIDAIIGPGCSSSVMTTGRLAAAWNIPHITYAGTAEALGNKTEFSTLTRLSFSMNEAGVFFKKVLQVFGWFNVAIIYDESMFLTYVIGTSLQRSFLNSDITSTMLMFRADAEDLKKVLIELLKEAKQVSRVFLVFCHGNVFRQMVLLAPEVGLKEGEFVFMMYTSTPGNPTIGDISWERGDALDKDAKHAYESVLVVSPRRPEDEEFLHFEREAMRIAASRYGYSYSSKYLLSEINIGHYDAFLLYANSVNEAIAAGINPRDGRQMTNILWNKTFQGIGGMVYVNQNGDRDADFSLLDLDPVSGEYRAVAEYLGYTHKYSNLPGISIHWPHHSGPPANKPKCGYMGELCKTYVFPLYGSITIGFATVIIIIVMLGTIIIRRIRLEADIYSQWWRINWEDVNIQSRSTLLSRSSQEGDLESNHAEVHETKLKTTGIYKGMPVHIRKSRKRWLTLDRKVLMELKQMRDINNVNLTRFIGVCTVSENIYLLTEHCSRGNLQDILQNESIRLDEDFRNSLIHDIVEGIYYIHNCTIGVHGSLTSMNCVIDSRFVLKVTGFGLPSINTTNIESSISDEEPYILTSELFWVAPEILRKFPEQRESRPGDVYAFGIILYEVCSRMKPYISEVWYQTVGDTIEQIKKTRPTPRRPSFGTMNGFPELYKLACECWKENATERPTCSQIRRVVLKLKHKNPYGNNVLDVLLHRMERYANNLEGLAEERTIAFLEEKKRSEELLYEVLPKSVADQLRTGQTVIPEDFQSVTIYFSDICGFTTISAASTPFQVVDFLNDVYTCFDEIIDDFGVYKVETIGDAYMVVSGLPVRNRNEHVREIARMSLKILERVQKFTIRHRPDLPLRTRIGLHTGPVVAGVVGQKMPRYCLFGDTVMTASGMESSGEPMTIHISHSTKMLLGRFPNFVTEERGFINIKGKGPMFTHWLIEELSVND